MSIQTVSLAIAVLALLVSVAVALIAQGRSDRRLRREESWRQISQRRERLRPHFEAVLKTAMRFNALAAPESDLWKSKLSKSDVERLAPVIDEIEREAAAAQVALKLEGQAKPIDALQTIRKHFVAFRSAVVRSAYEADDEAGHAFDQAQKESEAISSALPDLEKKLLSELESLVPPIPVSVSGWAAVLEWVGIGD